MLEVGWEVYVLCRRMMEVGWVKREVGSRKKDDRRISTPAVAGVAPAGAITALGEGERGAPPGVTACATPGCAASTRRTASGPRRIAAESSV